MKDFLHSITFKILLGVLALLLGMMIYGASTGGIATVTESVLTAVTQPFVKLSSSISGAANGFFGKFFNAGAISDENERLRDEIAGLREQLADYDKAVYENEQYKEMLKITQEHPDYEITSASVISRDASYGFGRFTIDKGTIAGVSLKDPVITPDGLVGYVSSVGPTFATVTTLLDVSIDIGCAVSRTRESGILCGDALLAKKGMTCLKYLSRNTTAIEGDMLITSGVGGMYPEGLLVGKIKSLHTATSGLSVNAEIEPFVDVERITDVMVITGFFGQGTGTEADGHSENEVPSINIG